MITQAKILTARLVIFDAIMERKPVSPEDCGVTPDEYNYIIEEMDRDMLIENVGYSRDGRGKVLVAFLNTAQITKRGEAYIDKIVRDYK